MSLFMLSDSSQAVSNDQEVINGNGHSLSCRGRKEHILELADLTIDILVVYCRFGRAGHLWYTTTTH